jgi:hypothetical protein
MIYLLANLQKKVNYTRELLAQVFEVLTQIVLLYHK